jgi:D-threo-aldose 1-dehydrogenase
MKGAGELMLASMGVSRLDLAFVHDISSDNKLLPSPWQEQFAIALEGAFPVPCRGCGRRGSLGAGVSA